MPTHLLFATFFLFSSAAFAFKADIRADSNRDGVIDIKGDTDVREKQTWTETSGAIFLANIGDTDRRCSKLALQGPPPSNVALGACNDASDDIQRAPQYIAPLLTVPIPEVSDRALGSVTIPDAVGRKNVRVFSHTGNNNWTITHDRDTFTAAQLRAGLKLGVDARDVRRPGGWDGRVTVHFSVTDGSTTSSDHVMLRVAPVLTHHHLEAVEEVLTVAGNASVSPWQEAFAGNLPDIVAKAGISKPVYQFNHSDDIWAQDFLEPGYTSMPGPDGTVSMRVMIRSAQDDRVAGRQLFEYLREAGWGAVQSLGGARDEINSMGNLETIPPYEHNGKKYPAGRIIEGSHGSQKPHILTFMQAQETQDPLILDTDWLAIGHVDEFVQFLPANNARGWVIMADDPDAGMKLLQDAQKAGHGHVTAFSRANDTGASNQTDPLGFNVPIPVPATTIQEVVAREDLVTANKECSRRIAANLERLKNATGVTDSEIFRLPAIFQDGFDGFGSGGNDTSNNTVKPESIKATAFYPGMVNGVVLSNSTYLAPNPWGPVIDGKDIFAAAASAAYAKVGLKVTFIDDWNTHHNFGGEVHCGTNTIRDASKRWW